MGETILQSPGETRRGKAEVCLKIESGATHLLAQNSLDRLVVLARAQGEDQGDELDRLGTRADDDGDLQLG